MKRTATQAQKNAWLQAILSHFLHVTFTDAATKEMEERIAGKCLFYGYDIDPTLLPTLTFNAIDMDLIHKFHEDIGYKVTPTVVDVNPLREAQKVLPLVTGDNKIPGFNYNIPVEMNMGRKGAQGALILALNAFKVIRKYDINVKAPDAFDIFKRRLTEESLYGKMSDQSITTLLNLYDEYSSILRSEGLLTFADQEPFGIELMDLHPDYLNNLGFWHIIIDEFQDSNDINMEFVRRMATCRDIYGGTIKSIMVIGDGDQSIYGFRDANVENITKFDEKIGEDDVQRFTLVNNYRSFSEIVEPANELVSKNVERIVKPLVAAKGNGGKFTVKGFATSDEEDAWIIEDGMKREGKKTIIARNRSHLNKLMGLLTQNNQTFVNKSPQKYVDNIRVKALLNFFDAIRNPDATQGIRDYLACLYEGKFEDDFTSEEKEAMINDYRNEIICIKSAKPYIQKQKLHEWIDAIGFGDELYEKFTKMIYHEAAVIVEETDNPDAEASAIVESVKRFKRFGNDAEVKLDKIYEADWILTTAHSSKGLEWDTVYCTVTDFDGPMYHRARGSSTEVEEERRLLFVSMTRAKCELICTGVYVAYSTEQSGDVYNQFLKELYEVRDGDTKTFEAEILAMKQEMLKKEQERKDARNKAARESRAAKKAALLKDMNAGKIPVQMKLKL